MSFDEIPEDKVEAYKCPRCGNGDVILINGYWICQKCEFKKKDKNEKPN